MYKRSEEQTAYARTFKTEDKAHIQAPVCSAIVLIGWSRVVEYAGHAAGTRAQQ